MSTTKTKRYGNTLFKAEVVEAAIQVLSNFATKNEALKLRSNSVERDGEEWRFSSLDEFIGDYGKGFTFCCLNLGCGGIDFGVTCSKPDTCHTRVSVTADMRVAFANRGRFVAHDVLGNGVTHASEETGCAVAKSMEAQRLGTPLALRPSP